MKIIYLKYCTTLGYCYSKSPIEFPFLLVSDLTNLIILDGKKLNDTYFYIHVKWGLIDNRSHIVPIKICSHLRFEKSKLYEERDNWSTR